LTAREFYLASRHIANDHPELLKEFLNELEQIKSWARARPDEVNRFLAAETGISLWAIAVAESRRDRYDTQAVNVDLIASQQSLADRYLELGLLPKRIDVKAAVIEPAR
jgi:sulfonate transport system substrate-binding protein